MKRSRAQFLWRIGEYKGQKYILIWDKDQGQMSITNDIENVVADIADHTGVDPIEHTIVYRDSEGVWDSWDAYSGSFTPWWGFPGTDLLNHLKTIQP